MSLTWLLDSRCFDENLTELKDELTRQNIKYIAGNYKPFGAGIEWEGSYQGLCDIENDTDNYFVYGSLQFSKAMRTNNLFGSKTHNWCNLEALSCNYYYPRLSKFLFNQDHAFLPYGELIYKEEWIFKTFGVDDCVFMRPNSGFKEFTGQVYEKKYWKGMIELSNTQIQPEDLVLVARPKEIDREFRVIIGPDGPITSSCTHTNRKLDMGRPTKYEEAYIFTYIENLLDEIDYSPDPFWVIDLALNGINTLSVVEVNSMSCSGLYKCDLSKIVGAIKEYFNG